MKYLLFTITLCVFLQTAYTQNKICIDSFSTVDKIIYVETIGYDTIQVVSKQLLPVSDSCNRKKVWWPRKRCWTDITYDSIITYNYFVPKTIRYDSPFIYCYTPPPVYGAMIFGEPDKLSGKDSILKKLGLNTVRETILVSEWPNNKSRLNYWLKNDYDVVLNVNYMAQNTTNSIFCPSSDTVSYRKKINEILNEYPNIKVVVVENEESNKSYRNFDKTSISEYTTSLKIAKEICYQNSVKCTNGGIMWDELKGLTKRWLDSLPYDYLIRNNLLSGQQFFDSCFVGLQAVYERDRKNPNYESKVKEVSWLIDQYNILGINYLNIHLYFPIAYRGSGMDASGITTGVGFKEIIAYLRSRSIIPVISNEIGAVNNDAETINNLLTAYNLEGLDYLIYYSGKDSNELLAKPLHKSDGTLNNQGETFKKQIE